MEPTQLVTLNGDVMRLCSTGLVFLDFISNLVSIVPVVASSVQEVQVQSNYVKLPLSFEANQRRGMSR